MIKNLNDDNLNFDFNVDDLLFTFSFNYKKLLNNEILCSEFLLFTVFDINIFNLIVKNIINKSELFEFEFLIKLITMFSKKHVINNVLMTHL